MRNILLFCIAILISSKLSSEINKPEEEIQNEDLDDLELLVSRSSARRTPPSRQNARPVYRQRTQVYKTSAPIYRQRTQVYKTSAPAYRQRTNAPVNRQRTTVYKTSTPTYKPNTPVSRPNTPLSRLNIASSRPNNPSSRPNTHIYGPIIPQSSKPNLYNPIKLKQTFSTPRNNASQNGSTSLINRFFNKLNHLPTEIPVIDPLNNKKTFNVGNKIKIGVENDFHNIKADGTYTNSRVSPTGEKIDTKYSGSIGAKFEDGKKGISGSIGKSSTTSRGPDYTQTENKHSFSIDANHKDGNKGIEASYTNTRTNGKGKKIGEYDSSQTNTNERKITGGGGVDKNGVIYGNIDYQNKNTNDNTKSLGSGNNKVSESDYNTREKKVSGGVKIDHGVNIDGSYSDKNIKGKKYSVGNASYSKENEVGNTYNGGIEIKKNGAELTGGYEIYNQENHKVKAGAIEALYSKKDYSKGEGGIFGRFINGKFNTGISGSIAKGQTHSYKSGDTKVTAGKEDKLSGNIGVSVSKEGVGINGQAQLSNTYSGSYERGKVKVDGSAGKYHTLGGNITMSKRGFGARINYEEKYSAQGKGKAGKKSIDGNGYYSKNTYGGLGVTGGRNTSANIVVGREYTIGGQFNKNGKQVGSGIGNAKGEGYAEFGVNKNGGPNVQIGLRGEGQFNGKFNNLDIEYRVLPEIGIDANKEGLRFIGGINPGFDIKKGGKIIVHIDGKDMANFGVNAAKAEVKNIVQTGTNLARIQYSISEKLLKSGIKKFKILFKP